jgi:hypothetical protein
MRCAQQFIFAVSRYVNEQLVGVRDDAFGVCLADNNFVVRKRDFQSRWMNEGSNHGFLARTVAAASQNFKLANTSSELNSGNMDHNRTASNEMLELKEGPEVKNP